MRSVNVKPDDKRSELTKLPFRQGTIRGAGNVIKLVEPTARVSQGCESFRGLRV